MAYFLISVSNKINLDLCIRYSLAGFTSSISGLWTYTEIQEGDFISFLYGARVYNLYEVIKKGAIKNADVLPPWPSVTFRMSGKTYYFPFCLCLKPLREFIEPMVRPEFAYVAENLLLIDNAGDLLMYCDTYKKSKHILKKFGARVSRKYSENKRK